MQLCKACDESIIKENWQQKKNYFEVDLHQKYSLLSTNRHVNSHTQNWVILSQIVYFFLPFICALSMASCQTFTYYFNERVFLTLSTPRIYFTWNPWRHTQKKKNRKKRQNQYTKKFQNFSMSSNYFLHYYLSTCWYPIRAMCSFTSKNECYFAAVAKMRTLVTSHLSQHVLLHNFMTLYMVVP